MFPHFIPYWKPMTNSHVAIYIFKHIGGSNETCRGGVPSFVSSRYSNKFPLHFWYVFPLFSLFSMSRWLGICAIEQNGSYQMSKYVPKPTQTTSTRLKPKSVLGRHGAAQEDLGPVFDFGPQTENHRRSTCSRECVTEAWLRESQGNFGFVE